MNYGDLQTAFQIELNRRDITPAQLTRWVNLAIQRAQRVLMVPAAERVLLAPCPLATSSIPIPDDLIRLISISFNGRTLRLCEEGQVQVRSQWPGIPDSYCRVGSQYLIAPMVPAGGSLQIYYVADFSNLVNPTDSNYITDIIPQAVIDASMVLACRFLNDERMAAYEDSFQQAIGEFNQQAMADELNNGVVSPGIDFSVGGINSCWPYYYDYTNYDQDSPAGGGNIIAPIPGGS